MTAMEDMRTLHAMLTQTMTQVTQLMAQVLTVQSAQTAQAQTITELQTQWQAQHNELHRDTRALQQASLASQQQQSTPYAAGRHRSLIDAKHLAPENFSGDKGSVTWRDWSFRTRSFVGSMSPKLRNLMERAETKITPVTENDIVAEGVDLTEVEELKVLLISRTTGQAHTVLREDDSSNGLEIYRRLARTFEPDSDFKNLADMSILIRPEPAKSLEDFARKFSQWKAAYQARLSRSGQQAGAIAEDMRRSIWIAMLPPREREDVDRHRLGRMPTRWSVICCSWSLTVQPGHPLLLTNSTRNLLRGTMRPTTWTSSTTRRQATHSSIASRPRPAGRS